MYAAPSVTDIYVTGNANKDWCLVFLQFTDLECIWGDFVNEKSTATSLLNERARIGSESIAHEGQRNTCFTKIQLVGQKYRE